IPAPRTAGPDDVYTRVFAQGRFLHDRTVLTQAVTVHGPGFWVVTPLRTPGFVLLVNRGFVAARTGYARPDGIIRVTGLIRMTEPGGGFLRTNDPAANRWYSRDVAAIAAARELGPVAPYFIDASGPTVPGGPIPGLTQTTFPNSHLSYALTWYTLALMSAVGTVIAIRRGHR
uniref:SURF1 family protein n=1 Tax=uncultured Sphingomonas sp. TaxID=158754 RepID=UPI002633883C